MEATTMGIDLSIYNGLLQHPKSVADYDAENQAYQQNALGLKNAQQQQADANALREATKGFGADTTANYNGLLRAGLAGPAAAYQKSLMENQKTQADINETNSKVPLNAAHAANFNSEASARDATAKYEAAQRHTQDLSFVQNPQDAAAYVEKTLDIQGVPPEQRAPARAQAMGKLQELGLDGWKQAAGLASVPVIEQLKLQADALKQKEQARHNVSTETLTGRGQDLTAASAKEGHAITVRGQNMADARSKESTAAVMTKPFEVTGPDGTPMLVQQDKQGNISPVAGYGPKVGSSKPLNDTQAKALGFGTRMQVADKILNDLQGQYAPSAINAKIAAEGMPVIGGIAGMAGNAMLSEQGQQAEQAQRDFVNAVLRRESGAAISDSEFANARKQYFPQPNDKPGNLAQKAANRKLAMEGVLAEVPKGQRGTIGPQAGVGDHPPEIADLLTKYGKK